MEFIWIIMVTLVIVVIQRLIFSKWGLRAVIYERYFNVQTSFVGDYVELVEKITNNKPLPVPWLRLESLITTGIKFQKQAHHEISEGGIFQNHRSLFSLAPYRQVTRRHRVLCVKRGYYQLESVTMSYGDILGVQFKSQTSKLHATLIVYPALLPMDAAALPNHSLLGDIVVRRWYMEDPFTIAGVREYMPGDALNKINWKASARTGQLQVQKLDYTADHHLFIYLNIEVSDTMWYAVTDPELIEQGISYAATLAEMAVTQGINVGFGCNALSVDSTADTIRIIPSGGKDHLYLLYEAMSKLILECRQSFHAFLDTDLLNPVTSTDYVVITTYMTDKIESKLDQLRRNGNSVQIVLLTKDSVNHQTISDSEEDIHERAI